MKRLLVSLFVLVAICFGARTAGRTIIIADEGGGNAEALQADNALRQALKKKEAKAAGGLLDQQFTWTNAAGQIRKRAQFLKDAAAGATDSDTAYSDVKAHEYGQLALVTGTGTHNGNVRIFFARVWVNQPAGWLLLTHQDTAILAKAAPSAPAPAAAANGASDFAGCENPCRTLPYTPKTAEQRDVVKAYQAVETAVTSHDAKTWADHVADEFVGIGRQYTGTPDTKAGRVGQIGIVTNHVVLPKMLRGEAYVFGDAAIIIADHQAAGEPPYHVIRVWVNRDGRWQLFHRQETFIENAKGIQ